MINYTSFGYSDWQSIVSDIKKFVSKSKKTAVVSIINGDANVPFYKELGNQGISIEGIPIVDRTAPTKRANYNTKTKKCSGQNY